jgi:hypothetical protein
LKPARAIDVKILSLGAPERYAVRRLVMAAQNELQAGLPGLELRIMEVDDSSEIGKYASVLVLPTLVIDERVVCSGQFPSKEAVAAWLRAAWQSRGS